MWFKQTKNCLKAVLGFLKHILTKSYRPTIQRTQLFYTRKLRWVYQNLRTQTSIKNIFNLHYIKFKILHFLLKMYVVVTFFKIKFCFMDYKVLFHVQKLWCSRMDSINSFDDSIRITSLIRFWYTRRLNWNVFGF